MSKLSKILLSKLWFLLKALSLFALHLLLVTKMPKNYQKTYIMYVFSIYHLCGACGHIGILKKDDIIFLGGRGQPKDDTGLCGGREGKPPKMMM